MDRRKAVTTTRHPVHRRAFAVLASAALLLCVEPAWAQSEGTIRGQVVAAIDKSGVADAAITLRSLSIDETTESRSEPTGWFTFPQVTPGEYVLSVISTGFERRELHFVLEPREVRTVSVVLPLAPVDFSVEVAGNLDSLPQTHSPSSTTLTIDRLESMPVFQRLSLTDTVVTLAPGMIRGHDDFVHIRGHEVALNPLINGVSFWENAHALFSPGLSPEIIQTASVMTGGFSAEYGNRFGGVVDIVTRSGLLMAHRGAVTGGGGGAGRGNVGAEFGGSQGRFGYFLFGSAFTSGRFLSPPDPEAIHDQARGGRAFVQLDGSLGRLGSLKTIVMGDAANFGIPVTPRDVSLRPDATPTQHTRQQTAIVGWTKAMPTVALTASFYQRWSRTRLNAAEGPLTVRAHLERSLVTIGGKGDVMRFVGRHAVKAGVDAVRLVPRETLAYDYAGYLAFTHLVTLPHLHVTGNAITFAGRDAGGQVSAYVQDSVPLGRRVTADVGLRVDRYGLLTSVTHASPRANLAFQVGGTTVLHASYNHFFVPPPVEGVLSSSAGLTQSIEEIGVPLPQLEPTIEDQFETGISTAGGPWRVAVTGYYRATDNPIHTTVWPDSRIYSYASFDRARAFGLETKVDLRSPGAPGLTGYLNYALGRVHFFNPVTGGFITEAGHVTDTNRFLAPMDQTHTLTGGVTYRPAVTGLWVGTIVEYGSGTPMGHGGPGHEHAPGTADHTDVSSAGTAPRVPGHVTANGSLGLDVARGSKRQPRLTLQFDLLNMTNSVYVIAQEGEFSPAQYSSPRLLSVSAKYRF